MKISLTQEQAELLTKQWQRILRLQDWDIKVKVLRKMLMTTGAVGTALIHNDYKCAIIELMSEEDRALEPDVYGIGTEDMELTLVHELMHVLLRDVVGDAKDNNKEEEAVVDSLSRSFLTLKRAGDDSTGNTVDDRIPA